MINRLKRYREDAGLTQAELAKRSGVNIRMIQKYEQGDRDLNKASGETLYRLATALGYEAGELIQKYVVTDITGYDEFEHLVTVSKEEAIEEARSLLDSYIQSGDAKRCRIEIRAYLYDNGGPNEDCWDCDTVDWSTWYAVMIDEDDSDWGYGSYDLDEAKDMAKEYKDSYIAVINVETDTCIEEIR